MTFTVFLPICPARGRELQLFIQQVLFEHLQCHGDCGREQDPPAPCLRGASPPPPLSIPSFLDP